MYYYGSMGETNTNLKKPTIIIAILLTLLVIGTAGALHLLGNHKTNKTALQQPATPAVHQVKADSIVQFTAQPNMSALEQLQQKANIVIKDSQHGKYVDSIDGIKGGTDGKYWTFYVDGQMANIGAGEYLTKGGENIVWRFE